MVAPQSTFMAAIRAAQAQAADIREFEATLAVAPVSATRESTLPGSVQFIIHERLARPAEPDAAGLAAVGRTTTVAEFSSQRPWGGGQGKPNEIVLPPLTDFLAADGHVDPGADGQVMEVLTSELGGIVEGLLRQLGIDASAVGALPWTLTEPAHLAATAGGVRPGPVRHTFVKQGQWKDKHVTVTLEGMATNASLPNTSPATLFQMHVAEGGPILASGHSKSTLWGFNAGVPGLNMLFGGSKFSAQPGLTYGHGWTKTSSNTTNLVETSGAATSLQGTRIYNETRADMLYRIYVTVDSENLVHKGPLKYAGVIVLVENGLSFLALERPAVDPRGPAPAPEDPDIVRVIGRRLRGAGPHAPQESARGRRMRLVRQVRATNRPGDDRMVPLVGLPATAVTDRLYPVTTTSVLDTRGGSTPGEGNPLLDAVLHLLSEHAPELLDAYWTVEGGSRARRVPARLQNLFNLQSMTMMIDMLLSTGLVVVAILPRPLGMEVVRLEMRGRRDPHNRGHLYLESLTGNSVRYATRLGIERDAWSRTRSGGLGSGAAQSGEPTVHNTTAPPGGQGQGTAGSGEAAGVVREWHVNPDGSFSQSTTAGGYKQEMAAQRDTLFVPGPPTKPHHRYGGDLRFTLSLIKTPWDPSPLVRMIGLNLPHYVASALTDAANTRREVPTAIVELSERVLVSHALIQHETLLRGPRPATSRRSRNCVPRPSSARRCASLARI